MQRYEGYVNTGKAHQGSRIKGWIANKESRGAAGKSWESELGSKLGVKVLCAAP